MTTEKELDKVEKAFSELPGGKIARLKDMDKIAAACDCPKYWRRPLYNACGGHRAGQITADHFLKFWENIVENYHDTASRFIAVVSSNRKVQDAKDKGTHLTNRNLSNRYKSGNNSSNNSPNNSAKNQNNSTTNNNNSSNKLSENYLEFHDFMPVIQDIVDSHPGLVFLGQAPEFHSRYVQTVICRIFYHVNRSWSGKITINELRSQNGQDFLLDLERLNEENDINQLKLFFSYEHFYVIYCKFWELDPDHDLIINDHDLLDYHGAALTSRVVERLMSGCVTKWSGSDSEKRTMGYRDFVWFLLAENDKNHPTAIEYWFRVLDTDGDGVLSLYELEWFYEEQAAKLQQLEIEPLGYEDVLCMHVDSIGCHKRPEHITLSDLKRSKMSGIFLDTFINTHKYLSNENVDEQHQDEDLDENGNQIRGEYRSSVIKSNWEKYCDEQYLFLSRQEQEAIAEEEHGRSYNEVF
jgi:serine/threonine-protein phosphatase 2A regulatory subunit B''